jgi:uncharacterized protein GlcG (DUF336 family)
MSSNGTDATTGCIGFCGDAGQVLTVADVQQVMAQAINEAQAQGANATIAVTDRVGNVLGVYRMGDKATRKVLVTTTMPGQPPITSGLEGITLPVAPSPFNTLNLDQLAAIAKAVTGAYLSSEGNAFSTRVASQIVQENFNPGEMQQAGGPLFGVQFSSLACSDFISQFNGTAPSTGPQRTPLGLSADPGGFPLYKGGAVVGAIGVIANTVAGTAPGDGLYTIDKSISDKDNDLDEKIATAGSFGFLPPVDRRGDRITVDGKQFQYTNTEVADLATNPATAPAFSAIPASVGALVDVPGYSTATIQQGTAFGQPASGIRPDVAVENFYPGRDAFVFVDGANVNRFPPIASPNDDPSVGLTAAEVQTIMSEAIGVANRARAQIRRPLSTPMRATVSIVDSQGAILAIARTRDGPVFGSDVSLQKARTAAFFSSPTAGAFLSSLPDTFYLQTNDTVGVALSPPVSMSTYVTQAQTLFNDPNILAGSRSFSARAMGNVARPFFPDGINQSGMFGPFSKPPGQWSVFSSGVQLDVDNNAVLQHVLFSVTNGLLGPDVQPGCAGVQIGTNNGLPTFTPTLAVGTAANTRIGNGFQIFAGGVPIYRGNTLIGGIGVSGDGIDQDDMVAFLGLFNGGVAIGQASGNPANAPSNAPRTMRVDQIEPQGEGTRLRYVQCPVSPFVDGGDDRICEGK